MSSSHSLSSEQALDDYFTALLEEELIEEQPVEKEPELAPMVQSVPEKSYLDDSLDGLQELEMPNLEDVQRLLSQMEASNPVAELELEQVMEQNTLDIQVATQPVVQEPDIQEPIVEEIQEWDVATDITEVELEAKVETPEVEVTESEIADIEPEIVVEEQVAVELQTQSGSADIGHWETPIREQNFQVLYFDVNGVTFAVPLDELGGIHRKAELNHLIGRPAWYLGLQTNRDSQLDVVDTAKWVMAEKLRDDSYKEAYQYIVMLGESMWGLACSQLLGTETLSSEKIRWREQVGKRPWLAGMVKEKMCALIHVEALIAMLNAGLDVKALDK
ncbi:MULTISPECIES: chemotaxis protein CheW [Vibrio]|jgi:purine-binding chemotaxis protein CheW|uniref:Chemotaxis protein CheW n=1 Tax=Vibrio diazotrophicus TaxID=685 RepID=A0A2J8I0B0_VIBDI|nr:MULTISPECIES: chemotaxis protein CheW [Vibrio]MCF7360966.1 chemotaxis protein CheW [Vibrio sp. A1-b2]PNH94571.1 chemotaxis protein CheW [Vibrio diazotrophicus]PNH97135.1 chemotaxis protein CheW [Vibrio diazotrophicus]PNI03940.1 chemotaxis protein CheW [Vibrio diazotrophicus]